MCVGIIIIITTTTIVTISSASAFDRQPRRAPSHWLAPRRIKKVESAGTLQRDPASTSATTWARAEFALPMASHPGLVARICTPDGAALANGHNVHPRSVACSPSGERRGTSIAA